MTRTQVGIVEWGRRVHGARTVEMGAADALGRAVATTDDLDVRLALVGAARAHAWRAEQWRTVVPVLHDVALDDLDPIAALDVSVSAVLEELRAAPDASAAVHTDACFTAELAAIYQCWLDDATALADTPYELVLRRVKHDANVVTVGRDDD